MWKDKIVAEGRTDSLYDIATKFNLYKHSYDRNFEQL